jgi:murein DD-endopeptidase MepM/ murein hydrolase activator NlpD
VPTGTSVKAVHTGTVVTAGWGGAYGNNIVIKHGPGVYTQYGHFSKLGVHAGQVVKTGQEIGKSGSTGNSTGPHLHFETRTAPVYGYAIEPLKFMRSKGVIL